MEGYIEMMRVVVLRIQGDKVQIKRPDEAKTHRVHDLEGVLRDCVAPIPVGLKPGDVVRVTISPVMIEDNGEYRATPETVVVMFHQR